MNERDKIIEVINSILPGRNVFYGEREYTVGDIADALIANGYGDVSEWKRRAEVAERALEYAVSEYRCDECPCIDCNAEIRGSQECVNLIAKTYKEEAERDIEREIEEEE